MTQRNSSRSRRRKRGQPDLAEGSQLTKRIQELSRQIDQMKWLLQLVRRRARPAGISGAAREGRPRANV